MKTFVCVLLFAAAVVAEPPQYRQVRFRSQKQETESQGFDTGAAPYPAAGYRPTKEFNLPSRQEFSPPATNYGIPADSYGAPFNTYLTPQTEYGVPQEESDKGPKDDEKEEVENVGNTKNEEQKENLQEEPKKDAEVVSAQGAYYVLLPGSQLQRVQFQTENDVRNMAYTARLQYRNEDRAPIFVYTAVPQYQSAAYVQLFK
ncbi:uncharacterized protein LOC126772447 [Nymphalis io]|uniref:uncharacterized protein LOC126772447 n=1 Tax=Inachis io TaxID=171585 RepID=UPI002167F624|nr:uncharacterized protein LOC126772447 [Nymphalis io]